MQHEYKHIIHLPRRVVIRLVPSINFHTLFVFNKSYLTSKFNICKRIGKHFLGLVFLLSTFSANGQIYVQEAGAGNALGGVDVGSNSFPVFVDIDDNGTLDAFIGNFDGTIQYFKNAGTSTTPNFVAQTGGANPFDGQDVGAFATPFFVDVDGDMDLDAFIGEFNGIINFYRNDGDKNTPNFVPIAGAANPLNGIGVERNSIPNFVDIDGDGDLDVFIAGNDNSVMGIIRFLRNDGGTFVPVTGAANPFDNIAIQPNPTLTFVDYDKDGDKDAFLGSGLSNILYFENTGTPLAPIFASRTGDANPFNGIEVGRNSTIIPNMCFVDIDADGDMDVFIGNSGGTINFFRCVQNIACPSFDFFKATAADNPLDGQLVARFAKPDLADIDGDGDFDLVSGNEQGDLVYFQNIGSTQNPQFQKISGGGNPFDGVNVSGESSIEFVDIDRDGDLDAFVGELAGTVHFLRNDGTAQSPNFLEITGGNNPFDGVDVGSRSVPSFVDIDGDGDLDAFIGDFFGRLFFFRNTGNAQNPVYTAETGPSNPFFGVDSETYFNPDFVDIDRDGDFDAIIGNNSGNLFYFRNEGSPTNPNFVGIYGTCNPFHQIIPILSNFDEVTAPTFADLDADGVQELIVGDLEGKFCFIDQSPIQRLVEVEPEKIPTFSQWGQLIFLLLVLNLSIWCLVQKDLKVY